MHKVNNVLNYIDLKYITKKKFRLKLLYLEILLFHRAF